MAEQLPIVGTTYTMQALVPGGVERCHAQLSAPLPAGTDLTPHAPAQSALDELRREVERLTSALTKANSQAEHFEREWYLRGDEVEALRADAERYRWLRGFATPGQRPPKDEMPMGYREIRLRVDTPVYMPSNWAKDVDRLIDAAMKADANIDSRRETNGSR